MVHFGIRDSKIILVKLNESVYFNDYNNIIFARSSTFHKWSKR